MKKLAALDCEIYPNYFLIAFKTVESKKIKTFELCESGASFDRDQIKSLTEVMLSLETFGFNSNNFDLPLILAAIEGQTVKDIFRIATWSIDGIDNKLPLDDQEPVKNVKGWQVIQKFIMNDIADRFEHFDIQEPSPGVMISLKLYGARIHSYRLQDLPIEPGKTLTPKEMKITKKYCVNDLDTTIDLYNKIKKRIDLRRTMIDQYGYSVMSKSDAQVAELVIKKDIEKIRGGKKLYKPNDINSGDTVRYKAPEFIKFKNPDLIKALDIIEKCKFVIGGEGDKTFKLPEEVKKLVINIGNSEYQLGVGGLHSKEKKQIIIPKNNQILIDKDVAAYYPRIILNLKLYPKLLGEDFLTVYEKIVETRLKAKREGNKVVNESLKIVINGSFGKLGSKWSVLYAPDLMIRVTITGQLSLLMLIEKLESYGIKVVSANTDGFVSLMDKSKYDLYQKICNKWQQITGFELEDNEYKALYSRDVNNYLALTKSGYSKGKGIFTLGDIGKNPQADICTIAVEKFLKDCTPIKHTIRKCRDLTKFFIVRKVNGGAVWNGQYLGKVVRWVYIKGGSTINYSSSGNKVPNSDNSLPVMEMCEFPKNIDFLRYEDVAEKILLSLGYKITKF